MKRLVLVGTGYRGFAMFAKNLYQHFSDKVEIVAVCDPNPVRAEYYRSNTWQNMRIYNDFEEMLNTEHPEAVIVSTVDRFHSEYIVKSLEMGYDVYSEKPMCITAEQCTAIRDAERRTGHTVTVTFNCRFMPYYAKIKELLMEGKIGRVLTVNYNYSLNPKHGGEYFMRWHRHLASSGGMMVHKATHHFDVVNWLLNDEPVAVSANGSRMFFGNDDRPHGERCGSCEYTATCPVYNDYSADAMIKPLYFDAEHVDGYIRDHCAFLPDTDIYDSMSVSVKYKGGAMLTYALNLFDTREGYKIDIIGENGAIEASNMVRRDGNYLITIRYRNGEREEVVFPTASGTHAGGDVRLLNMFFGGEKDDPLGQCSDSFDGAISALIGIAANQSIKTGERVDLVPIIEGLR